MKSYLSLVPISAKVRKRQNRMTILCVIISIFLVTAIFSVADMMIRTQSDRMTGKNGSWHIELDGISQETALKIAERDDVFRLVQLRYLTRTENCPTAWTEKGLYFMVLMNPI